MTKLMMTAACLLATASMCFAQFEIPAGFPDASTTGLAGVGLSVDDLVDRTGEGSIIIDREGAVIEGAKIQKIRIFADNVTIRRCYFAGGDPYPIDNAADRSGLVIEDCTFVGNGTSCAIVGRYVMRRCDISGYQDGVKIKSGCVLQDSYIHDLWKTAESHNDCIQKQTGNSLVDAYVLHNTLMGPYMNGTSAIICGPSEGETMDRFYVHDNFIFGGAFAMQFRNSGGVGPTNVSLVANTIADDSYLYGPIMIDGSTHELLCNFNRDGVPMDFNQSANPPATPVIAPAGGAFVGPTEVTITCATPGATIRYTTDYSPVTESSPIYTGPFTLIDNAFVKARAYADGMDPGLLAVAVLKVDVNKAPTADAGVDQDVVDVGDDGVEDVTLDASASTDVDGAIVSYVWTLDGTEIATGETATVSLPVGVHVVTLTVTDDEGGISTDEVVVNLHPGGHVYTIYAHTKDVELRGDGTTRYDSADFLRVGGGQSGTDGVAILPFALPVLESGETLVAADATVRLAYISNSPIGNVDLYGLGSRVSPSMQTTDFYQGVYEGDASDAWPIMDDFAIYNSSGYLSTDEAADARLLDYLNAQYAAGAQGGEYVFLRLNPDVDNVQNFHFWVFKSADNETSLKPVLTIKTSIAAALSGDANGDGHVDIQDFVLLKQNYGGPGGVSQGDFNGDGTVDIQDFVILKQNYGR